MHYYAPTKLYIGEEENKIGEIIASYGFKKVMIITGQASSFKNGLIDKVTHSLEINKLEYIIYKGVKANPSLLFVRRIYSLHDKVDLILAIGGGSVIDTAKSLAVSLKMNVDPWDFNSYKVEADKALPIGVILTIAAAGSEMSNSCVITNEECNLKQGFNSDVIRPLFAIMNPKLTYSVSKYQTACGIVDIMMHTLERFITDEESLFADEVAIGLLKTVYRAGKIAYYNPENYEARKALMLASSFSHNGLTEIGRNKYFRAHKFEHVISGFYPNVSHGAGLAVVWHSYALSIYQNEKALPRFLRLAYEVFMVSKTADKQADALAGIKALDSFFQEIGMPLFMDELNIPYGELERFSLALTKNKTKVIPDIKPIDYNRGLEIFKGMWKK